MSSVAANPVNFSFDAERHAYVRLDTGVIVPSVTQCLKATGLVNFDGIPVQVLERKARLGRLVHQATELLDKNEDLTQFEIPDEVFPYLDGYVNFKADCHFRPTIIESRMLGEINGMVYGMQPDRVGELNGVLHLLELKSGTVVHPAFGVQLAGYSVGLYGPRPVLPRVVVQLGPTFPRGYKLHPCNNNSDFPVWMSALALTIWQQNNKLVLPNEVSERLEWPDA